MAISFNVVSSQPAVMISLDGQGKNYRQEKSSDSNVLNPAPSTENNLNSQPAQRVIAADQVSRTDRQTSASSGEADPEQLDNQQKVQQVIAQLKARDQEVRAHEMAHLSVAGAYARGMSFTYQTGPDGQRYAIGGEVGIDTSPIANDPRATLQKAVVIQRAAMAPAEPSAQDFRVAASAGQMMVQARAEIAEQRSVSSTESEVSVSQQNTHEQTANSEVNAIQPKEKADTAGLETQDNRITQSRDLAGVNPLQAERAQFELRLNLNVS